MQFLIWDHQFFLLMFVTAVAGAAAGGLLVAMFADMEGEKYRSVLKQIASQSMLSKEDLKEIARKALER